MSDSLETIQREFAQSQERSWERRHEARHRSNWWLAFWFVFIIACWIVVGLFLLDVLNF